MFQNMKIFKINLVVLYVLAVFLSSCANSPQRTEGSLNVPSSYTTAGAAVGAVSAVNTANAVGGFTVKHLILSSAPWLGVGGVFGGAFGHYYDTVGFKKDLEARGGEFIILGDEVRIVLPADILFDEDGTELKESAEPLLARITRVLLNYGAPPLLITGYSDDIVLTDSKNQSFSYYRAQSVATFLWTHGILNDSMTVQGLGLKPDTANNDTVNGRFYNRRVEITCRVHNT